MKEIKVDLLPLIRRLDAVLKKGFSRELMTGGYKAVFKGKGLEFVGFREYSPNDDALLIDWKASLKANKHMVRVLEEERNLTVFFLLDVADSMLFSSHGKLKCEYAAELVGTLCYAMQSVGDNVGIAMFNDKIVKIIPPGSGKSQFYKIVKSLSNASLYGGKFDFSFIMRYVLNLGFLSNDSVVFIISDFIGMKSGWEYSLKLAGLKFDLTSVVVRDPVDMRMPEVRGEVSLADPYSKDQMLVNPQETKHIYELEARNQLLRIKEELNKTNSSMLILETDKDFTNEIFKFFKLRQKLKS
jgi:uncharacterized protein (DUF58 family)